MKNMFKKALLVSLFSLVAPAVNADTLSLEDQKELQKMEVLEKKVKGIDRILSENDQKIYEIKQELKSTEDVQQKQELENEIGTLEEKNKKTRKENEADFDTLMRFMQKQRSR